MVTPVASTVTNARIRLLDPVARLTDSWYSGRPVTPGWPLSASCTSSLPSTPAPVFLASMVTGIHSPALTTSWYPRWTVRVTPSAATAPTDAPARPVTVSKAARAIRAGRRQRRWACIYCTKTAAEGKSSVLASSAAVWRGAGAPAIGRGAGRGPEKGGQGAAGGPHGVY